MPDAATRDDRVLVATTIVALLVIPFLAVAAVLLFGWPAQTGTLFAWPIAPPLSAYLLASAYIGGIWFFARVVLARRWHRVAVGFPAVVVFAGALLIATLLHLDKFSANLSFFVWMALYVTTPFVIAALAVVQRRYASVVDEPGEVHVGPLVRVLLLCVGGAALLTGVVIFVAPAVVIPVWAWDLTPLTARVLGAVLSLTGVVAAGLIRDTRWSSYRIILQAQIISLAAIVAALVLGAGALHPGRPVTWLFIGLIAAAVLLYLAVYVGIELRRRLRA